MKIITEQCSSIHEGHLILVNGFYPYEPRDISLEPSENDSKVMLCRRTAVMLQQLMLDSQCIGQLIPVSGYRSYEEQKQIYMESVIENGKEFTRKYVALPGHSEHQTGMAIDMCIFEYLKNSLEGKGAASEEAICPSFGDADICKKFRQKAPSYGFIERYPSGKEKITGISHEPWHFRYVGYPHSEIIDSKGITLEEYIELIKTYHFRDTHYQLFKGNRMIEIFYCRDGEEREIDLNDYGPFQVSGNNVDGYIFTVWRIR